MGLVYAGLIFWFQGALQGLEFTRDLIEDLVAPHGKVLLDLLVGVGLVSLFSYFSLLGLASVMFWMFALLLTKDLLQFVAARGYLTTLFSTKFIPKQYGPVRSFVRKLRNAGIVGWIVPLLLLLVTVAYPIFISSKTGFEWRLNEQALVIFLLAGTAFSLLQVRSLLVEAIAAKRMLEQRKRDDNNPPNKAMESDA